MCWAHLYLARGCGHENILNVPCAHPSSCEGHATLRSSSLDDRLRCFDCQGIEEDYRDVPPHLLILDRTTASDRNRGDSRASTPIGEIPSDEQLSSEEEPELDLHEVHDRGRSESVDPVFEIGHEHGMRDDDEYQDYSDMDDASDDDDDSDLHRRRPRSAERVRPVRRPTQSSSDEDYSEDIWASPGRLYSHGRPFQR